jgi:ferredoxin
MESNPKKAALNLVPHFPAPGTYEMQVCTQCGECALVCPTQAIQLNERGAYYVDPDLCDLCEACVDACPDSVMYVRPALSEHAWKCDLCGDCVSVCGTSALWIAN